MHRRVALLALMLAVPRSHAESPVARLAADFADQIAKTAGARAVELSVPEDRTRRGASIALDLRALVAARLEGRLPLSQEGPRLRVVSVLSDAPRRLLISARVVEEPGGRLVDLLSASVEADEALLGLASERLPAAAGRFEVTEMTRTSPLDEPALALALVGDEQLAIVGADAVSLYRLESGQCERQARHPLPGPLATVRAPGAIVVASPERALWVLASRAPRALLVAVEGKRLVPRADAEAAPWPGAPAGIRFRAGTNLLDAELAGFGAGPFLALTTGAAVAADGELRLESGAGAVVAGPRVGPTLAELWPGVVAASTAEPPGREDAVMLIERGPEGARVAARWRVDGAVRALAGSAHGDAARLVVAVEDAADSPAPTTHLLVMDVRRHQP